MLPHPLPTLLVAQKASIRPHAEPERGPVSAAIPQGAAAVDAVELPAEGLTVERGVESGATGNCGGVDQGGGYGYDGGRVSG